MKKNQKPRKRKPAMERSTDGYEDKRPAKHPIQNNNKFHLVYVNQTRSTTCTGCNKKYRQTERGKLPRPPNDMILGIKMHRLYPVKGTTQIRLTKDKVNCYFHLRKSCIQQEFPDKLLTLQNVVIDSKISPPKLTHKLKLREEFDLIIE